MAKKSRRARRRVPSSAQPVRIHRDERARAAQVAEEVDFSKEYHYVLEDLKRIGLIAAGLFVLLIVLVLIIG
ncbi:MAG: hypothetical protein P8129_14655 [Anaerolineae bacterium]|jgi:hypothetical protein